MQKVDFPFTVFYRSAGHLSVCVPVDLFLPIEGFFTPIVVDADQLLKFSVSVDGFISYGIIDFCQSRPVKKTVGDHRSMIGADGGLLLLDLSNPRVPVRVVDDHDFSPDVIGGGVVIFCDEISTFRLFPFFQEQTPFPWMVDVLIVDLPALIVFYLSEDVWVRCHGSFVGVERIFQMLVVFGFHLHYRQSVIDVLETDTLGAAFLC